MEFTDAKEATEFDKITVSFGPGATPPGKFAPTVHKPPLPGVAMSELVSIRLAAWPDWITKLAAKAAVSMFFIIRVFIGGEELILIGFRLLTQLKK